MRSTLGVMGARVSPRVGAGDIGVAFGEGPSLVLLPLSAAQRKGLLSTASSARLPNESKGEAGVGS